MGPQPPEYLAVFQASPRRPGQVHRDLTRIKREDGNVIPVGSDDHHAEPWVGLLAASPNDLGARLEPESVPRARASARAGARDVNLEWLPLFPSSTSDVPPPDRLGYFHSVGDRQIGSGLEASARGRPDAAPSTGHIERRDSPQLHPPPLGSVDEPQTTNDSISNSSSMYGVVPGDPALQLFLDSTQITSVFLAYSSTESRPSPSRVRFYIATTLEVQF